MSSPVNQSAQPDPDSPVLQELRRVLIKSGYCDAGVSPTLENIFPPISMDIPSGTPLHTLLKFFYSNEQVAPDLLKEALGPLTLDQLLSTGLCVLEDDQVVPNVFIQPYEHLLFVFTEESSRRATHSENVVMKISETSLELAHLMNRRRARNALDLGTGCGFLATQLSPHADRVYALDLNSRAVQFAARNARWNSLSNITCLQGNLFEPVRELRFDLIVCNPPFFICPDPDSPVNQFRFAHSGEEGDSFCLNLARQAASFLNEDGFFHMMFSWIQTESQDWQARLAPAFSGLDCDVWCLRTGEDSSEDYVSGWCTDLLELQDTDFDALYSRGLAHFQKHKIASVGTGLLTLRRCTTRPNQIWFDEAPDDRSEPYGSCVANLFDLRAKFDSTPDELFLREKFAVAPDIATIEKSAPKDGRWEVIASELCCDSGLKYTFSGVDPLLSEIVTRLDAQASLRELLTVLAEERDLPLSRVMVTLLPKLRELLRYGFIQPASAPHLSSRPSSASHPSSR
ncbi:MAG: class I SAM-dependent methyltransferase [Candidatus Acidiferrum sp.]